MREKGRGGRFSAFYYYRRSKSKMGKGRRRQVSIRGEGNQYCLLQFRLKACRQMRSQKRRGRKMTFSVFHFCGRRFRGHLFSSIPLSFIFFLGGGNGRSAGVACDCFHSPLPPSLPLRRGKRRAKSIGCTGADRPWLSLLCAGGGGGVFGAPTQKGGGGGQRLFLSFGSPLPPSPTPLALLLLSSPLSNSESSTSHRRRRGKKLPLSWG